MHLAGSARVGPRPAYGENRISERGGVHDRIGLPAGVRADERYGDQGVARQAGELTIGFVAKL